MAEHTGNVWTPVVALRREDAERLGYDNAENWQALVNASICDIAKAYKIRPETCVGMLRSTRSQIRCIST